MPNVVLIFGSVIVALLVLTFGLSMLPKLGGPGRGLAALCARAPVLDLLVALYTVVPPVAGAIAGVPAPSPVLGRLAGAGVALAGQIVAMVLWAIQQEVRAARANRIHAALATVVGPWRSHVAVWWTMLAVPVFFLVRLSQFIVYPPLTWLVRLPRYRDAEWVNVSRHKFEGLIGYDLFWCLYCDWMTGVWSLGSEMLRNVESFWCPIRFSSPEKCANCRVDFPDIDGGWAPADSEMADVVRVLHEQYPGPEGDNQWFGHPARLTVHGAPAAGDGDEARSSG